MEVGKPPRSVSYWMLSKKLPVITHGLGKPHAMNPGKRSAPFSKYLHFIRTSLPEEIYG